MAVPMPQVCFRFLRKFSKEQNSDSAKTHGTALAVIAAFTAYTAQQAKYGKEGK